MGAQAQDLLASESFSGFGERNRIVVETALARAPQREGARLLDLGAGTGDTLLALAADRPDAQLEGVDVSEANVARARERIGADGSGAPRIRLHAGDYLATRFGGPFDVIVADQVLHLIGGSSEDLARKLAADLVPGGVLVAEMPYAGRYNTALISLRRVLRRLRGPALDRAAVALARRLYSGRFSDDEIRERIVYNYVIPARLCSTEWDRLLGAHGLQLAQRTAMRHESVAQPRHHLSVYVKS